VDKFCPKGAAAQIDGLVDFKPKAYGSYKEVVQDSVSTLYPSYLCEGEGKGSNLPSWTERPHRLRRNASYLSLRRCEISP